VLRGRVSCRLHVEFETAFGVARNAAPIPIAQAEKVHCLWVALPDGPAKPRNRSLIVAAHASTIMVKRTYMVLSVRCSRFRSDPVVLERNASIFPCSEAIVVGCTQPRTSADVAQGCCPFKQFYGCLVAPRSITTVQQPFALNKKSEPGDFRCVAFCLRWSCNVIVPPGLRGRPRGPSAFPGRVARRRGSFSSLEGGMR